MLLALLQSYSMSNHPSYDSGTLTLQPTECYQLNIQTPKLCLVAFSLNIQPPIGYVTSTPTVLLNVQPPKL